MALLINREHHKGLSVMCAEKAVFISAHSRPCIQQFVPCLPSLYPKYRYTATLRPAKMTTSCLCISKISLTKRPTSAAKKKKKKTN